MKKICTYYFAMIIVSTFFGLSSSIQSHENICFNQKECDNRERNRNQKIHTLKGDLHSLRWNIEDYGATPEIYDKLDAINNEIESICISCPECQLKKCQAHQRMLQRKSRHTKALAERLGTNQGRHR